MSKKSEKTSATPENTAAPAARPGFRALAVVFVAAFALAFAAAWLLLRTETPPVPPPAPVPETRTLSPAELDGFLQAVADGDFAAMNRLGTQLFTAGTVVPDSAALLGEFETNTYSDVAVYALYSSIGESRTTRVLLTVDKDDKVVSFLAEEMPVIR